MKHALASGWLTDVIFHVDLLLVAWLSPSPLNQKKKYEGGDF